MTKFPKTITTLALFYSAITPHAFVQFAAATSGCEDSIETFSINKQEYQCTDGLISEDYCLLHKFKAYCPLTCDNCDGNQKSGAWIKGEWRNCSDAANDEWLCKAKKFRESCVLACGEDCSDSSDKIQVGNKDFECSDALRDPITNKVGKVWLCKKKKFNQACPVACKSCGKKDGVYIKGKWKSCSESTSWLCKKVNKFKKACRKECNNMDNIDCSNPTDTSGSFKMGKETYECSDAINTDVAQANGGGWLCKRSIFQKNCPVTCKMCEVKNKGVLIKGIWKNCSDATSDKWLCKIKKFRDICIDQCNV